MTEPAYVCSLENEEMATRRVEWRALEGRALIRAETQPDGRLLVYRGGEATARALRGLIKAERRCCPFLDFRIDAADDEVRVTVTFRRRVGRQLPNWGSWGRTEHPNRQEGPPRLAQPMRRGFTLRHLRGKREASHTRGSSDGIGLTARQSNLLTIRAGTFGLIREEARRPATVWRARVPGQCRTTASRSARLTTELRTTATITASSTYPITGMKSGTRSIGMAR